MSLGAPAGTGLSRRARQGLVLLAAAGFLAAVYLQLPAALALRFLPAPLPAPWVVQPAGLVATGTVWHGEVQGLQFGTIRVDALRWEISPWAVLLGRLRGQAHVMANGAHLDGAFNVAFDGSGELSALQGELPLAALQSTNVWRGQLQLQLDTVVLASAGPTGFVGNMEVRGLSSPVVPASLGDFRLEWTRGSNQGRISTLRGPVALQAALLPGSGGRWRVDGEATPAAGASPAVLQSLARFGLPDNRGRYRVQVEYGVSALP